MSHAYYKLAKNQLKNYHQKEHIKDQNEEMTLTSKYSIQILLQPIILGNTLGNEISVGYLSVFG